MTQVVKGRNVRVEIGATYDPTGITVTAITNANPGVATAAAHGLLDADAGYFDGVSGMEQLNEQAIRVDAPLTNTFSLQGYNTTQAGAFSAGKFHKVLSWLTLAESTSYDIPDAESEKLDATRLIDNTRQQEAGYLAAQSLSLDVLAMTTSSPAMQVIEAAAQANQKLFVRITHPDGSVRIAYGEPSLPGERVGAGALGTGSLSFATKGYVLKLAA